MVAAAAGAAMTALASTYIAHRLIVAGMDTRLRGAAVALADEIRTAPGRAEIARDVEEDGRELAHSGMRVAVYDGGRLLAGDPEAPPMDRGGCETRPATRLRVCAAPAGTRTVVVAGSTAELRSQLRLFAEAALIAVLATVGGALLTGRRLAKRVVGPLTRLREVVDRVPDHAPGSATLGQDEGWEEVDALRTVLLRLLGRLDRALVQARRFAADAAHELRTPVATMRAELELIAEEPEDLPAVKEAIARVHRTLLSASALIERLLILALPPEGGDPHGQGQAVAMVDVVRESIAALPEPVRARLSVETSDDGIVRADGALIRAMVDNALDNALKFGAPGPVVVRVETRDGRVLTAVRDHGPGVPAEERQRVFQPFYRTPQARAGSVRGHGIGLALIAHVAAGHGGQAAFLDVADGSLLEITLPAWTPVQP
jgi:signal transduction histidine kinase